jgi:transcriptional regulator with XRE-family HTH domain
MGVDNRKIRILRQKLGLSPEQAGRLAEFEGRVRWNYYENGRRTPRIDVLEKIAKALGTTAKELLK